MGPAAIGDKLAVIIIVAILSLTASCCSMLSQPMEIHASLADTIGRAKAPFCDEAPKLVDTTSPFFPFAALAQVERHVGGTELLAVLDDAERREAESASRYKPRRIVLPGDGGLRVLIGSGETKKIAGCYAELSPRVQNPYRSGESGAFLRIFRGGAVGRSGSTAFWVAMNSDGTVDRLVPLPLFVD